MEVRLRRVFTGSSLISLEQLLKKQEIQQHNQFPKIKTAFANDN
jgi:hypothetical protein